MTVDLTNVPSSLVLEKSVVPTSMDEPGGDATYTIFVTARARSTPSPSRHGG
ncbi:MAG: hypothetical protein R2851_04550 [Caldilineaceae bacterium]